MLPPCQAGIIPPSLAASVSQERQLECPVPLPFHLQVQRLHTHP
jgi:hypothetical protein